MIVLISYSVDEYNFFSGWLVIGCTTCIILMHFSIILLGLKDLIKSVFFKENHNIETTRRKAGVTSINKLYFIIIILIKLLLF